MLRRLIALSLLLAALPATAGAQQVVDDNPAATSSAPGRFDVAARAADGTVVVRSLDVASGAWSPWEAVRGISATSGPAISADDDGTLHVFARTGDAGAVVESVRGSAGWSAWAQPTGGKLLNGVGSSNRAGTTELDIGVIGLDGAFYHAARTATDKPFTAFERVAGAFGTTTPGMVSRGASLLDVFTRAADGSVTNVRYTPGSGWTVGTAGGTVLGAISPITRAAGQMDIYARAIDGSIVGQTFDGSAWGGWVRFDSTAGTSAPAAAVQSSGRVDMVVRDAATLYHAFFTPSVGWSAFAPVGPIETPRDRGAVNGIAGGDGAKLTLGLAGTTRAARTYGLGKRVSVRGQLVNAAGAPIAGATVQLRATALARGAGSRTVAVVTTAPDGTFAHGYPAGVGRRLDAQYLAYANEATVTAQATVRARTRASSTLRISRARVRRGQVVRFTGRLRGGAIPRGGKTVTLQAYERGRWRTFADPRSNRKGAFVARYRFGASPSRAVRLRFRALVRPEAAYPFARGASKSRRVTLLP